MAASGAITLILAIASWHLVEKRALALARPAGDRLARMGKGKAEAAATIAG